MTVDELTQQTLYRREDWQRVYDHVETREMLAWWDELAEQCARKGLSPGMAHAMIDMVPYPKLTEADLNRIVEYGSVFRRERIWPWLLICLASVCGIVLIATLVTLL